MRTCAGCGLILPDVYGIEDPCPGCGTTQGLALDAEATRVLQALHVADSAAFRRTQERYREKTGGALVMFVPYASPGMRAALPTLPEPMEMSALEGAMARGAPLYQLDEPRVAETDRPATLEDYEAVARLLRKYGEPPTPVPLEDPVLRGLMLATRSKQDDGKCQVCGERAVRTVLFCGEPWLRVCRTHAYAMGDTAA